MDELLRQAISILQGMWHRRWLGLAVAWLVGIVGVAIVFRLPDMYEAQARIYVDTQSLLKPLMQGIAVQPNVDQQVAMLSRTLISRTNIEKLIRMADLDLGVKSKADHDAMAEELMKALKINSAGRDNLYALSYRDSSPEKAKRLVQSLTSVFIESNLGDKRKDSNTAKKFIDDQIKIYEKKLEEAENRLKEFKIRNLATNELGRDYFSQVKEMTALLNQARLEYREAEQARDSLKREITNTESGPSPDVVPDVVPEVAMSVAVPEIDSRIEPLRRNLDGLMQRFTEQHPDVANTKRQIKELETQKAEILAARAKAAKAMGSQPTQSRNPVYQQLKVALAEAEGTVASLRARVTEYEARFARLKESAKTIPQMEAEFAQLNRDYDVNRKNYEGLVSRREVAEISGEMEAVSGAEFRLIDPPRVSPRPVAPDRMLLLLGAFLVALAGGIFASFAASQVWPTFTDVRMLREVTGLPVLGSVSMIVGEAQKRRERHALIGFLSGLVTLLGSFGAGLLGLLLLTARAT